jgi:hypothetical protein
VTDVVFAFLLALRAFGGVEIEVKAKTREACEDARAMFRKQLLLAGVTHTLTDCAEK